MTKQFNPNEQQLAVLNSAGKNQLVSASAGSGKTAVMTEKIGNLVGEKKAEIKSLLVLTYTNAAASEMKQRIAAKIACLCESDTQLSSQLDALGAADITTFHAFYQHMVRKYFYALGINPSFRVLAEDEAQKMKIEAVEEAIQLYREAHPDNYFRLLDTVCDKRSDKKLRSILFELCDFLSAQEQNWQDEMATSLYQNHASLSKKILAEAFFSELENYQKKLQALCVHAESIDEHSLVAQINGLCSVLSVFKQNIPFEQLYTLSKEAYIPDAKATRGNRELGERYKKIKKDLKEFIQKFFPEHGVNDIENSLAQGQSLIADLFDLFRLFGTLLFHRKKEKNSFEFNDFEQFFLQLLANQEILKKIQHSYTFIFADEYQDVNRVQAKILEKIAQKNNLFLVGDPKQSIYAFRQSDPDIFVDKIQKFLSETQQNTVQVLSKNYRSDKRILNFVNLIFTPLMTKEKSGIEYADSKMDGEILLPENGFPPVQIFAVSESEIIVGESVLKPSYRVKEHLDSKQKQSIKKTEASLVADQICQMLGQTISDGTAQRKISFSDFAVLVRTRSDFSDCLCEKFTELRIPFTFQTRRPALSYSEIETLFHLLSLASGEEDNIAYASVLVSPLAGLSMDDLAKIKLNGGRECSFSVCIKNYPKQASDDISRKIDVFLSDLADFSFLIQHKGIFTALTALFEKTNYLSKILCLSGGEEMSVRVKTFVASFRNSIYEFDLPAYLQFVQNAGDSYLLETGGDGGNVVTITTIHGSKGLEYPIVFVCDLGSDFTKSGGEKIPLTIHKDLGIALPFYEEENRRIFASIPSLALKVHRKKEDISEKIRLFYVALTRAKNHLYLVGKTKQKLLEQPEEKEIDFREKTYMDFLLTIVKDKKQIQFVDCENFQEMGRFPFEEQAVSISENERNLLKKKLEFSYPFHGDIAIAQKTTVTKMAAETEQSSLNFSPKNFTVSEHLNDTLARNEIGNFYHAVLERIPLNLTKKEIDGFVQKEAENLEYTGELDSVKKNINLCLQKINEMILPSSKIYREQKFILQIKRKSTVQYVQGKIDLFCLGRQNVLIDYKYSSLSHNSLLKKYAPQLNAYRLALEEAFGEKFDNLFLLSVRDGQLLKVLPEVIVQD